MGIRASWTVSTSLALAAMAGCANEHDDWPVRPSGGGTGGGAGRDAQIIDAASDGEAPRVTGLICIVDDLRQPDVCPATDARRGVNVRRTGTETSVVSDDMGRFVIPADGPTAELDVGDGAPALVASRMRVLVGGTLIHAPIVPVATWTSLIDALDANSPQGTGAIVAYVEDSSGPASGVVFDGIPGGAIAPFYDAGEPLAWRQTQGTGTAGVTLFLSVQPGTFDLTANRDGQPSARLTQVSVDPDRVTFVRGRLQP